MRVSAAEAATIRHAASAVFGQRALMWLFGSRVDDAQKGGDIDLYVELPSEDYAYSKQVRFWCELISRLGHHALDKLAPYLPIGVLHLDDSDVKMQSFCREKLHVSS